MPKSSSVGAAANRSIAASASARSPVGRRESSSVSTRTPVAAMPHASSCPSRTRWSTAARMSGIASSRSPRRAFSRAKCTFDQRSTRPGGASGAANTSLTSARSAVRGHAPQRLWRCTSAPPSVIRAKANAMSLPDRSAIRRASSISRIAESSGLSTPVGIPEHVAVGDDRGVGQGVGVAGHGKAMPQVHRAIRDDQGNNGP